MLVPPGDRRNRVDVYDNVQSRGANGEVLLTATKFAAGRWVRIQTEGGKELANAKRIAADTTHVVQMRYDPELAKITEKMYVLWDTRKLNIIRIVIDNERTRGITLYCKEKG